MVFLADDCENDDYKKVLIGMAKNYNVPVMDVPSWIELKDACKLGLDSEEIKRIAEAKGKEAKIKPKCSSAGIVDWGEDSPAKTFLLSLLE